MSSIIGAQKLSKKEQKSINGGMGFPFPLDECCVCVFRPAGVPYLVLITQSCDDPCPEDGATNYQGTGC